LQIRDPADAMRVPTRDDDALVSSPKVDQLDGRPGKGASRYGVIPSTAGYVEQMKCGGVGLAPRELNHAVDASPRAWENCDGVAHRPNQQIERGIVAPSEPERLSVTAPSRRSRSPAGSDHERDRGLPASTPESRSAV
jgi:hypothetical protein